MTQNPHNASHVPLMDGMPVVVWPYGQVAALSSPCPEWQLLIGELVEIRRHGLLLGIGLVDDATASGHIAWIAADGINSRNMIEKADGYELSIAPPARPRRTRKIAPDANASRRFRKS
jgi:hypothetical protein